MCEMKVVAKPAASAKVQLFTELGIRQQINQGEAQIGALESSELYRHDGADPSPSSSPCSTAST